MPEHQSGASSVPIVWSAPLQSGSGYAEAARCEILALDAAGIDVRADACGWPGWSARLATGAAERLERLAAFDVPGPFVHVVRTVPETFPVQREAVRTIGRTVFETDGLPAEWVPRCNAMDEVWVASDFNLRTFATAGVAADKLHKIPETFRTALYERPAAPLRIPGADGIVFLSVFAWGRRKGWDALVRAYLEEFGPGDDVSLVLAVAPGPGRPAPRDELDAFIRRELRRDPRRGARILIWRLDLPDAQMPRLYRRADAFVMPSRGEGWGRTYMEAMASGLPTIGTRWGGNLEFMNEGNSYLLDCTVVDVPAACWRDAPAAVGQRWAEPSVEHLRELLRRVLDERSEARERGARAREEILERYSPERFADAVVERLRAAGVEPARRSAPGRAVRIQWHGDVLAEHSLAVVNRELGRALIGTPGVEIAFAAQDGPPQAVDDAACAGIAASMAQPARVAQVHVRQRWPPDFTSVAGGRLVVYQPWEWGPIPTAWIAPIDQRVDEVWVPSMHARQGFVESGVDPAKVAVVPNGIDPLRFTPSASPLELPTGKRFRFLFVGGAIRRKGADIALRAYLETFGPRDDVCLVIKDIGGRSFYRDQGLEAEIRALQGDPRNAEILYLRSELPAALMPALYRACDCLVAPYRAEGFGLPIAEAMACGLPVIVTGHGACLDFCDPSVAYLVPAQEICSPEARIGKCETAAPPRWAEVDRVALAAGMRKVIEHREEARVLGLRASAQVRRELTWGRAADVAFARLQALSERPVTKQRRAARRARRRPRPDLTLAVLLGPGEHGWIPGFADQFGEWPGDVVVIDDSGGDGGGDLLEAHLRSNLRNGAGRFRMEQRRLHDDYAAGRNRAHELARGRWLLHADIDERWDRVLLADLPRLTLALERTGRLACGFARANYLDGVLVNDLPRSEWHEEGLRRARPAWPPRNRDYQFRLVIRDDRWTRRIHEVPRAVVVTPDRAAQLSNAWIVHAKTLARQRRRDQVYALAGDELAAAARQAGGRP